MIKKRLYCFLDESENEPYFLVYEDREDFVSEHGSGSVCHIFVFEKLRTLRRQTKILEHPLKKRKKR